MHYNWILSVCPLRNPALRPPPRRVYNFDGAQGRQAQDRLRGEKLGLFLRLGSGLPSVVGFVFWSWVGRNIGITLWGIRGCIDFGLDRIGFVLRNTGLIAWQAGIDRWLGQKTENGRENADFR